MPRGRQHYPRRKKRDGEVWHKNGGRGPCTVFRLCIRCKRAFTNHGLRLHLRNCFAMRTCRVCLNPFPCRNRHCPWLFPEQPIVPAKLVPYFRRKGNLTPELLDLEIEAFAWLESLSRKEDS